MVDKMDEGRFIDLGDTRFFLCEIESYGRNCKVLYYEKVYEKELVKQNHFHKHYEWIWKGQIEISEGEYYGILSDMQNEPYALGRKIREAWDVIESNEAGRLEKSDLWMEDVFYLYIKTVDGSYYEFLD